MTVASDNPFPSVLFAEHVDPSTPPADHGRLFLDTDGILKWIDDAGTVSAVALGSLLADPMTTRGDIIVRNASNVTARLARGSANTYLKSDGTDVAYAALPAALFSVGSSNPGSPSTNDLVFRTDLGEFFQYNGTRWLCTNPHAIDVATQHTLLVVSATNSHRAAAPASLTATIWLETLTVGIYVTTTNDASKYWTVGLNGAASPASTQSLAADTVHYLSQALGSVFTIATTKWIQVDYTKVSTAGTAYPVARLGYRHIAT